MLARLLVQAAQRTPDAESVCATEGTIRYGELDTLANRVAHVLQTLGVGRGDRVAIWNEKSIATVASMQAALRLGAAYVPVDPLSPPLRASTMMADCGVRAMVTTSRRAMALPEDRRDRVPCLGIDMAIDGGPTWQDVLAAPPQPVLTQVADDELAYVLYTSGSTGQPKGVSISQRNALAFIDWATELVEVRPEDRLANHASFHFDLSVFDLYAAFKASARVTLVPEREAFLPTRLVELMDRGKITIWYSVPSALVLMMDHGELLQRDELALRCILFAGEPFPIKYLRRLQAKFGNTRLINFYGPTETNVCTYHEVDYPLTDAMKAIPIGTAASGDRVWARTSEGHRARPGEQGELYVDGPTVMLGYWGHAPQAGRPYATGDIVRFEPNGNYHYIGRRDHMVKVHGHRIELGEIETALALHPRIHQATVIVHGTGIHARLVAFLVGDEEGRPSLIEAKAHCATHLPRHMIVDRIHYVPNLPRTPNGKVDRASLLDWLDNDNREFRREEPRDGTRYHADGDQGVPGTGSLGRH